MADDPNAFSNLTNSLQTALLLSARLETGSQQSARDAEDLRAAVERAATAARELRSRDGANEQ
jgi:hypothetical protein